MGKKIESILEMHNLGLPAPKCVFIMKNDNIYDKLTEYFSFSQNKHGLYTIRTDTLNNSISCKRKLSATQQEIIDLSIQWYKEGFQIILQEFIDEREEIKSGNILLKDNEILIEGSKDKHIIFTNGKFPDIQFSLNRFYGYDIKIHKFFINNTCFLYSEMLRLIRLARKIPYTNCIIEFSFFSNENIYFWEIKKLKR